MTKLCLELSKCWVNVQLISQWVRFHLFAHWSSSEEIKWIFLTQLTTVEICCEFSFQTEQSAPVIVCLCVCVCAMISRLVRIRLLVCVCSQPYQDFGLLLVFVIVQLVPSQHKPATVPSLDKASLLPEPPTPDDMRPPLPLKVGAGRTSAVLGTLVVHYSSSDLQTDTRVGMSLQKHEVNKHIQQHRGCRIHTSHSMCI